LKYYSDDVRRAVKLSVLADMAYLAKRTPHMWTSLLIVVPQHAAAVMNHSLFVMPLSVCLSVCPSHAPSSAMVHFKATVTTD